MNSGTHHTVTNAELIFTFTKLYDLIKTRTKEITTYLKRNYMNEKDQKSPKIKLQKYRDDLENAVGKYELDMDLNKLPYI
jgi:hypothetical protein